MLTRTRLFGEVADFKRGGSRRGRRALHPSVEDMKGDERESASYGKDGSKHGFVTEHEMAEHDTEKSSEKERGRAEPPVLAKSLAHGERANQDRQADERDVEPKTPKEAKAD